MMSGDARRSNGKGDERCGRGMYRYFIDGTSQRSLRLRGSLGTSTILRDIWTPLLGLRGILATHTILRSQLTVIWTWGKGPDRTTNRPAHFSSNGLVATSTIRPSSWPPNGATPASELQQLPRRTALSSKHQLLRFLGHQGSQQLPRSHPHLLEALLHRGYMTSSTTAGEST